jgi:2,3,4,5-tetrahydropyridine-2-carboxylate N-succinyltransferase
MDHGRVPFYDKDTLPLRSLASPPACASSPVDRRSATALPRAGRHLHAADVVNIGAWIGEQSLVDSHALVGSCAQVGARVHISAAAGSAASSNRSARCR